MRNFLFVMGELADKDIDWLIGAGTMRQLAPGTVIIREGVKIDSIYIVLDGTLEVILSGPAKAPAQTLMAGEIVGELSFLDSRPPLATVRARTACSVFAIPREALRKHLETNHAFAAGFYRALGISLAVRFRSLSARAAGAGNEAYLAAADQLDDEQLDTVNLASTRFDWMLRRFLAKEEGVKDAARRPVPR
jgi:CRP-like cAMP-binding protein